MNATNFRYDYNLAKRFAKDTKNIYHINVITPAEIFEYNLNLYEKDFGAMTLWENMWKLIDEHYEGSPNKFLDAYDIFRNRIIVRTTEREEYKLYNSHKTDGRMPEIRKVAADFLKCDIDKIPRPKARHSRNIYNHETVGKTFTSIDLRNANFQMMQIGGVIKEKTYRDYIFSFAKEGEEVMADYIAENKYNRQVIFGKMNCDHHIALERECMICIYHRMFGDCELMALNSDEIIIEGATSTEDAEQIVKDVKDLFGLDVKVETFTLDAYEYFVHKQDGSVHKLDEFYKRSCDAVGVWKGVNQNYRNMIVRLMNGETPQEYDYYTMLDKRMMVKMLEEISIKKIGSAADFTPERPKKDYSELPLD